MRSAQGAGVLKQALATIADAMEVFAKDRGDDNFRVAEFLLKCAELQIQAAAVACTMAPISLGPPRRPGPSGLPL